MGDIKIPINLPDKTLVQKPPYPILGGVLEVGNSIEKDAAEKTGIAVKKSSGATGNSRTVNTSASNKTQAYGGAIGSGGATTDKVQYQPSKKDDTADPDSFDSRLDVARIYLGTPDGEADSKAVYHALSRMQEDTFIDNYYSADAEEMASMAKKNDASSNAAIKAFVEGRKAYSGNTNFIGVPSLINNYTLTKLYGYRVRATSFRDISEMPRYYEMDDVSVYDTNHYSRYPRTSTIIRISNEDPFGRTPLKFADFCFCKFWNRIPNNRMLILRRYSAPTYDNLSFPGMEDEAKVKGANATEVKSSGINVKAYTPFATAISYFGDETGNTLKSLLSFSSGMRWAEASTSIWDVQGEQQDMSDTMSNTGSNKVFKGVHNAILGMGTLANVLSRNEDKTINPNALFMKGLPDPFTNGPYENLIIGPVNVIDKTYKRARGLDFENDINVTFEYVARPIDNLNCKAVLLDVLSNVLALGTASGMFLGGGHRFNVTPALNPFQNTEARNKWYEGKLLGKDGAVQKTVENVQDRYSDMGGLKGALSSMFEGATDVFKNLIADITGPLSGDAKPTTPTSTQMGKNITNRMGALFANALNMGTTTRYMSGMKALLTGDPVGEWHLTIGNPLNPIAMIGNLICTKVAVEFSEELGQDDFPIGFKAVFTLKHGMPRDMDAIESMFNRGQGRIYELPDKLKLSSASQSQIDSATKSIKNADGGYNTAIANSLGLAISGNSTIMKGQTKYTTTKIPNGDSTTFAINEYFTDAKVNELSAVSKSGVEALSSVKNNQNLVMLEAWTANKILG